MYFLNKVISGKAFSFLREHSPAYNVNASKLSSENGYANDIVNEFPSGIIREIFRIRQEFALDYLNDTVVLLRSVIFRSM